MAQRNRHIRVDQLALIRQTKYLWQITLCAILVSMVVQMANGYDNVKHER